MQYSRIFEPTRLGKAVLVGMALCLATVSAADAKRKIRHPHHAQQSVSSRSVDDGGITSSPRYAAYVVDDKTGRVLYARNENELRHPASLTKMMTLYLLFEDLERRRFSLSSRFTASPKAAAQAPSKLGIRPGQNIAVEDAIRALVTRSANDVAVTIAENVSGSEQAFAKRMTSTARRIGMSRSTFWNASGLPNGDQWTTAKDMVTLGRALQERFPSYYRYFNTRSFAWGNEVIGNHNRLLARMEGVDGIKTGYTQASGFNLVSSIRRDNRHLVAAVLGGSSGRERDDHMVTLLTKSLPAASTGAKISSVLKGARSADASDSIDDDAPMAVASAAEAETTAAVPASTPPTAAAAAEAPEPVKAEPAPAAPAPAPTKTADNQPRIARSDVTPFERTATEERISTDHGAAVAMARAILLPPTTAHAAVQPAQPDLHTAAAARPETPPSLAHATIAMSEVASLTTGSVPTRKTDETPAAAPTPAAEAARNGWLVQIGAYDTRSAAHDALARARDRGGRTLARADDVTESIGSGSSRLWRARFSGFENQVAAEDACRVLKRKKVSCLPLRQ